MAVAGMTGDEARRPGGHRTRRSVGQPALWSAGAGPIRHPGFLADVAGE
jgi:hypothetical protein